MSGSAQQVRIGQRLARLAELMAQLIAVRRDAEEPAKDQKAKQPPVR
jgi:hypothetical protein